VSRRAAIDWDAARARFLALGPRRSFGKVAAEFGVSDVSVGKRARQFGWAEAARRFDAEASRKVEQHLSKDRARRLVETLEATDLVRQDLLVQLREGRAEVRVSDLAIVTRIDALAFGEPTDRVELGDVRHAFQALADLAARFIDPGRRQEFLAELMELASTLSMVDRDAVENETVLELEPVEEGEEPAA
jgi:hypothetical protein